MQSKKFDIISISDKDKLFIVKMQLNYSFAFRKLYKHFDKINDKEFLDYLAKEFKLSKYLINCLIIDVKTKFNQVLTNKQNLESEIISLQNELESLNKVDHRNRKQSKIYFKLIKKLEHKNKMLSKDITFGGLELLKQISYLSNDKSKNKDKLLELKNKYLNNRLLPINYIGSSNDPNSNRYFNFDFDNNKIIYKPEKSKKIEINYIVSKGIRKHLLKLQEIKDLNLLPISIKLTSNYIVVCYDEEVLNGYGFNVKKYKTELTKIDSKDKIKRHDLAIEFKQEQSERKLIGKLSNRYCGIDLNPEYIGVCIADKIDEEGHFELINKFVIDMSLLMGKSGKSSDHKDSIYLNSKRKFEIGCIYKNLFDTLIHYKCAYFIMEDLDFKSDNINTKAKEANRKTKNIWNLNMQINLINKHSNINGIQIIKVNPVYSSFIGNLMYNYYDPLNAAIEICRRGIIKYKKDNKFYPKLSKTIIDTVMSRFELSDVQWLKVDSWSELFKKFKETELRYRWQLEETSYNCFSRFNTKSRWKQIFF